MTARKRALGSDLKKVDAHVSTPTDYEEIPELTDADFTRGVWHEGGVARRRGRPKIERTKQSVHLRLDADIVAHFRKSGPGWQTRINATLRDAALGKAKKRAKAKA